jgi:hypothetical protein
VLILFKPFILQVSHYTDVQHSFIGYSCNCKRLLTLEEQIIIIMVDTKPNHSFRCLFRRLEDVTSSVQIRVFINKFLCK